MYANVPDGKQQCGYFGHKDGSTEIYAECVERLKETKNSSDRRREIQMQVMMVSGYTGDLTLYFKCVTEEDLERGLEKLELKGAVGA